ncbi:MAG TPA: BON domain-containing protein [Terriglobales bacterium]|jgi:osmotically-inducible protein OsmY
MKTAIVFLSTALMLLAAVACSRKNTVSYKDNVKTALAQADYNDVRVDEDQDKNTITLGGKVHSQDAKQEAGRIAGAAAATRIVVNEISVEPEGAESQARDIQSDMDTAIEKNYKAVLIAKGLDNQSIDFDAKNGVLKLSGRVRTPQQRTEAEQVAAQVPNVAQVLNQIEVRR